MAPNDAGAMQKVVEIAKKEADAVRAKTAATTTVDAKKDADIQSNTFYKIILGQKGKLEDKKKEVVKAIAIDKTRTKEENLARLEELNVFKEFMQERRKDQALAVIAATDTEVFGRLQGIIENMHQKVKDFDVAMEPLMATISAVYALRQGDKDMTHDAFLEIQADAELDKQRAKEVAAKEAELQRANGAVNQANARIEDITTNKQYRGFFGGIKKIHQDTRTMVQQSLPGLEAQVAQVAQELAVLKEPIQYPTVFTDPAMIEAKAQLRDMLNIKAPDHQKRQKALVDAATGFVTENDKQLKGVKESFNGLKEQLVKVDTNNTGSLKIYNLLTDATGEASKLNQELRQEFEPPVLADGEEESAIAKMEREEKKTMVEEHIKAMTDSSVDTIQVTAELEQEAFQIKTTKEMADKQIAETRSLQSSGNAGIAMRLSSTLAAVNNAAIHESTAAAKGTMKLLNTKTNAINMNEAIRAATGLGEQNDELSRAVGELAEFADFVRNQKEVVRDGLKVQFDKVAEMKQQMGQFSQLVKESKGLTAEAAAAFAANDDGKGSVAATATAAPAARAAKKGPIGDFGNL